MRNLNDPFFLYPSTPFSTSAGEVELPILYFDTSNVVALFWVDFDLAKNQLGDSGLKLVRFRGNRALATVAWFEYRDTTVGVYNEVGVALAVVPEGAMQPNWPLLSLYRTPDKRQIGFHILDLPVTTEAACAAGREIWGYPKFITPIQFSHTEQGFEGVVEDPGGGAPIVRMEGTTGFGIPAPPMDLVLYSRHTNEGLLRAVVNVRGRIHCRLPGSVRLEIGGSTHPMANRLRELGLQGSRPMLIQHTDAFQSRLNAGVPMEGEGNKVTVLRSVA